MVRICVPAGCCLLVALALSSGAASAKTRTCSGTVSFSGTPTKVVTLRGVSCKKAKSVLRAYDRGRAPSPWICGLAHAPFSKVNGRRVGLSCGHGSGSGDLRSRSHAFVGTISSPR